MTVTKNFNNLDTDNTLGGNSPSDYRVSSQKAIKEYVDNGLDEKQDNLIAGTDLEIIQSGIPPSEYTQVEYLESNGTQIIDLGLKWTYNVSTKTVCEM